MAGINLKQTRHKLFVIKAVSAATAALGVYNQPNLDFREEAFCQLIIAAWEALLKARILKENKNKLSSIFIFQPQTDLSTKKIVKRNRSGNELTLGFNKCLDIVRQYSSKFADKKLIENLHQLIEIRDNSAHLLNLDPQTCQEIHIAGTTAVLNFLIAVEDWFDFDISKLKFVPLPIGYLQQSAKVLVLKKSSKQQQNLLQFLDTNSNLHSTEFSKFSSRTQIAVQFNKDTRTSSLPIRITNDPKARAVRLSEDDWNARYPLTYKEVIKLAKKSAPAFKTGKNFNIQMRKLEKETENCYVRLIDPKKPDGSKKKFYSAAMPTKIIDAINSQSDK